jgi:tRNA/rRNA methyltransferase
MTAPVVILVQPQLGQNIGMAARAMLNFGLTELRLVNPRDGWPNADAGPAASGADHVLDGAAVFDSLSAAKADCVRSYATAQMLRGMTKEVLTPAGFVAAARPLSAQGKIALVFGPERAGLTSADVALCDAMISIPTNPEFGSLNIAMAVTVCAYAWASAADSTPPLRLEGSDGRGLATSAELDGFVEQFEAALDARGYFFPPARAQSMRRSLGNILRRVGFTAQEVQTLRGVVRALERPPLPE